MSKLIQLFSNKWILTLFRIILGGIFIWASLDKIIHPQQFAKSVENYHLVPLQFVNLFAIILPHVEILSGLLLIAGFFPRSNALIIMVMLFMFTGAMVLAMVRGIDIGCGCFKAAGGHKVGYDLLVRNSILILCCLPIILFDNNRKWAYRKFFSPSIDY